VGEEGEEREEEGEQGEEGVLQQQQQHDQQPMEEEKQVRKRKASGLLGVRALFSPPPLVTLEKDIATWTLRDVWEEFISGRGTNRPLAFYIYKWRTAWRPVDLTRLKWHERSMLHKLIIETAKALEVPNNVAAALWIEACASCSFTLYQLRKKVTQWNVNVKEEEGRGIREHTIIGRKIGEKYVKELRGYLNRDLPSGGRENNREINAADECVEWPAFARFNA
jgi:hypothetical protein